jgi:DNA repair photolyase
VTPEAGPDCGAARAPIARQIEAKVLLAHVKQPDPWFALKYNMNLYRGCQHRCIYCDSRSECYGIDGFDREVLVKVNAIELLRSELARKRKKGPIGLGSMNDPYMPLEAVVGLTGRALEVIAERAFPVHVMTKSDLVLRDIETLGEIARHYAAVTFTITCTDDDLARKLEPGAPPVSARLRAMAALADRGIRTGVAMMPVLPFLEDSEENVASIVEQAARHGASYIIPGLGVTLRDRQRDYFYRRLDVSFPGLRQRYEAAFGSRYWCPARGADRLGGLVRDRCARYGLATRISPYAPAVSQPRLL